MDRYRVTYDRKGCIGAGECEALSPELWKLESNGKAKLIGAALDDKTQKFIIEMDETQAKKQQAVAGSCPTGCITVKKL